MTHSRITKHSMKTINYPPHNNSQAVEVQQYAGMRYCNLCFHVKYDFEIGCKVSAFFTKKRHISIVF